MADENRPFRFLQISDVLLDARLSFKGLGMSASKRFERNEDAKESFLRLSEAARQRQLDAVVITGNLIDGQSVTAAAVGELVDAFARLGDIPVLILPGLADPLTPQSLFNRNVLNVHALRQWTKNVHIFSEAGYSEWIHPLRPHVRFYGRANLGFAGERSLVVPSQTEAGIVNVLLDFQPFTPAEQAGLEAFDYVAFGGSSACRVLSLPDGRIRAACAGSLVGRSIDQLGPRTALLVEIEPAVIPPRLRVDRVPADHRQLVSVSVNINGVKPGHAADYIAKSVEAAGARPQVDLVHVIVSGIYAPGQLPDLGEQFLSALYYHVKIDNHTRPDYFLDKADQRTTAGRFIQVLQDLKNKAQARGGILPATEYGGALTTSEIEDALYYGLEALNQKKVTVPDAD
jgi:hypothetical protein